MLIYVTCPTVAAETALHLGFNTVPAPVGDLLVSQKNAYSMTYPKAFPAFFYCDPDAVAPGPTSPPPPPPAPTPPPPPCPPEAQVGAHSKGPK